MQKNWGDFWTVGNLRPFFLNPEQAGLRTCESESLYSGVTHKSLIFGFGLRHIRVSHLV